jgi:aspartyl-tRNA(Asn)/glutamyl-tRNA(Gln) amidotransferase subunit C
LSKDLTSIFKFIEQLNELNTNNIKPLSSILNEPLRSRKDEITDGKIREKILDNSPQKNEEFFVVPKVIE